MDQFIQGMNHSGIEKKLLEVEGTLTLAEAVKTANMMLLLEGTENTRRGSSREDGEIARISSSKQKTTECWRCGKRGHKSNEHGKCKAVGKSCRLCGLQGHFAGAKFCKKTPRGPGSSGRLPKKAQQGQTKQQSQGNRQNQITDERADFFGEDMYSACGHAFILYWR